MKRTIALILLVYLTHFAQRNKWQAVIWPPGWGEAHVAVHPALELKAACAGESTLLVLGFHALSDRALRTRAASYLSSLHELSCSLFCS